MRWVGHGYGESGMDGGVGLQGGCEGKLQWPIG